MTLCIHLYLWDLSLGAVLCGTSVGTHTGIASSTALTLPTFVPRLIQIAQLPGFVAYPIGIFLLQMMISGTDIILIYTGSLGHNSILKIFIYFIL